MVTEGEISLELKKVRQAINALKDIQAKLAQSSNALFPEIEQRVFLNINWKKIPQRNILSVPLPFSPYSSTVAAVLFVDNLDRNDREYEKTVHFVKDKLAAFLEQSTVKLDILPLKAITTQYGQFEAKRRLANMYDVFLADKKIYGALLPKLGKNFILRNKWPIEVNMEASPIESELTRAFNVSSFSINGRGSSSALFVGSLLMKPKQLAANCVEAVKFLSANLKSQGGPRNILNIFIKIPRSPALPLHISTESGNEVVLPEATTELDESQFEDVTTVLGANVKVTKDFDIAVKRVYDEFSYDAADKQATDVKHVNVLPDNNSPTIGASVSVTKKKMKRNKPSQSDSLPKRKRKDSGLHKEVPVH